MNVTQILIVSSQPNVNLFADSITGDTDSAGFFIFSDSNIWTISNSNVMNDNRNNAGGLYTCKGIVGDSEMRISQSSATLTVDSEVNMGDNSVVLAEDCKIISTGLDVTASGQYIARLIGVKASTNGIVELTGGTISTNNIVNGFFDLCNEGGFLSVEGTQYTTSCPGEITTITPQEPAPSGGGGGGGTNLKTCYEIVTGECEEIIVSKLETCELPTLRSCQDSLPVSTPTPPQEPEKFNIFFILIPSLILLILIITILIIRTIIRNLNKR